MRTRQKQCVATDTWRSLGCRKTPLEHWSKRKPTVKPEHDKTNKMTCVPSEDSNQPVHPPRMTTVFAMRSMGSFIRTAKTLIRLGILLVISCGGSFSIVNAFKYGNDSVWRSLGDNALSWKKDKKEHGMHNTVIKHAYPLWYQRKFAYTNLLWPGSIVRVFYSS